MMEARMAECHPDKPFRSKGRCAACESREWRAANPDKAKKSVRDYTARNLEATRKRKRERMQRIRQAALQALGGKCVWCGFDDWRGLEIDHIDGARNKERPISYHNRAIALGPASGLQILCGTHHLMKTKGYTIDDI